MIGVTWQHHWYSGHWLRLGRHISSGQAGTCRRAGGFCSHNLPPGPVALSPGFIRGRQGSPGSCCPQSWPRVWAPRFKAVPGQSRVCGPRSDQGQGCIVLVRSLGLFPAFARPPPHRGAYQTAFLSKTVQRGMRLPGAHRQGRLCDIFVCRQPRRIKTSGVSQAHPNFWENNEGKKKTSELFFFSIWQSLVQVFVYFFFGLFCSCFSKLDQLEARSRPGRFP